MTPFCIIPCGSKKVWDVDPAAGPTPAKRVYVGPFASKCRDYAERFCPSSWCILSAKYGFLLPDDVVPGPYDVTFNDRRTKPISATQLVVQAKEKGLDKYNEIIVLGGRKYVRLATEAVKGPTVIAPLSACKGIGYMMQKLKIALTSGTVLRAG